MKKGLASKVVVITGASAGVGRAAAQAFGAEGARVALLARDEDALSQALEEVRQRGGSGMTRSVDVADPDAVEAAADAIEESLGPIDVWINNAMVSVFGPVAELQAEEGRRVTEVTYLGAVYGTLSALRRMRPRRRGKIIQVGSALAYRGIPLQACYCAAKHALQGFNDSLRAELLSEKMPISLTMVQMPALNTPQFDWVKSRLSGRAKPVPPIYQPEVAARALVFAATHERREMLVGSMTAAVVYGNKLAPALGDWYLAKTGIESQQAEEPESPDRPNNLWEPVSGLHATHGRFDDQAKPSSSYLWLSTHRGFVLAAVGLAAFVAGFVIWGVAQPNAL